MHKGGAVQILMAHRHSGDLAVIVGRVVVDALVSVAAAGVEGDLILAAVELEAAALLLDRAKDVEELAYAAHFIVSRFCVATGERHTHKAGH